MIELLFHSLYIDKDDNDHPQQDTSVELDKGYPQQDMSIATEELDHQEINEGIVIFLYPAVIWHSAVHAKRYSPFRITLDTFVYYIYLSWNSRGWVLTLKV